MMRRDLVRLWLMLFFVLCSYGSGGAWVRGAEETTRALAIGERVAYRTGLRDLRGNRRSLQDFAGKKTIVAVFLGSDCPVSNLVLPGLIELEKRYRSKDVQFLAVYPNEPEDFDRIAAHAADRDVPFLVLKDFGQRLAEQLGVTRVPSVTVLDREGTLVYRGRVSDQYGVGTNRPQATRQDLVEALDAVLAGKKIAVPETEPDGCPLDRSRPAQAKAAVTFTKDVAPILQKRCQECHRPDQSAPFALLTYEDAVSHAAAVREVTTQRRMPPWHADPRYGHFANSRRLTSAELETLTSWLDGGMARGDEKDLPPPVQWPTGWVHGKPDLVIQMPEEFDVPADGTVPYKNWIIDPHFDEDKWVTIAEARPGVPAVVHHIVAYILKPGQTRLSADGSLAILVGWAPGDLGLVCPPDTALRVPKGSRLRLEMHYTPNGTAVKDRSSIGITFARKPPRYEMLLNEFANMAFEVPPYDQHFKAEATFRLRADARILSFAPHMHWRGKDYRYEVIYPDGRRETLLSVPRYNFNWQNVYRFEEPLKLPRGAKLHAVAHWDNSTNNPLNPDPAKKVVFGLQSWEEMMVGFVAYVWERPETAAELAKQPLSQAEFMFERMDTNGDDVLTLDEIPERLRPMLLLNGVRWQGKMTREEFTKVFNEMRARFPQRGGNRGGQGADAPKKAEPAGDARKNGGK